MTSDPTWPRRAAPAVAVLAALLATVAPAAADEPPATTYTNPVYGHDFPDPFVLEEAGRYYAYGTQTQGTGFQLLESPDLIRWTPRPLNFPVPWARQHYWAPEVTRHEGRFYLTYSALDPTTRKHHIAIATASRPTGPFTHRAILVRGDENRVGVIDAVIAFDDGRPFLIYSEETPRRIVLRELEPDLLAARPEVHELIRPDQTWERGVVEAPTVVKRNGVYHLFYSGGPYQGTRQGGHYAVSHASSRSLLGPYRKSPRPLLESVEGKVYGPGHQCILRKPDGSWWVLYHAWDAEGQPRYGENPHGRTLRIDRLEWDGDTPRILGPTITPQPATRPQAG
jgi:beta-xylosidase